MTFSFFPSTSASCYVFNEGLVPHDLLPPLWSGAPLFYGVRLVIVVFFYCICFCYCVFAARFTICGVFKCAHLAVFCVFSSFHLSATLLTTYCDMSFPKGRKQRGSKRGKEQNSLLLRRAFRWKRVFQDRRDPLAFPYFYFHKRYFFKGYHPLPVKTGSQN